MLSGASLQRPQMLRRLPLLLAVGVFTTLFGCSTFNEIGVSPCDRSEDSNPPVLYTEGFITEGDQLVYQTSEFDEELLYWPGGQRYEIQHGLGEVPNLWQAYLSFDRYGSSTGTIASATGNQVELLEINEESMTIANGSCVDYWLVVVASTGNDLPAP